MQYIDKEKTTTKNNIHVYPIKPQFCYIKRGSKLHRYVKMIVLSIDRKQAKFEFPPGDGEDSEDKRRKFLERNRYYFQNPPPTDIHTYKHLVQLIA